MTMSQTHELSSPVDVFASLKVSNLKDHMQETHFIALKNQKVSLLAK